ncbi:type I secretion system permease/ATPase [Parasulfitobacter algicola]|uniref:Type I secretion system permease/ATPase n=1 Tax=Parasulfitobacter algicola TaxID=2614809 RepID=A0ABX2IVX5_9RHOB|nr:type I secretion system permease/ATPase [Sulfitobacter algicola]NSX54426.1 type I secretion system permease/ATPase [Sulfitobacter algicola]
MKKQDNAPGLEELRQARSRSRSLYWMVGIFSFFANMLMLTGPMFMLAVYNRVLSSRSEETLIALSLLVAFLYGIMGILDYTRGRVMARVGARFQSDLDRRVFSAVMHKSSLGQTSGSAATGLRDLEAVQRFMISPALTAVFDIPWTPVFLIGITIFHPWLGMLAVFGGVILITVTILNQFMTQKPINQANSASYHAEMMSEQIRNEAEMVQSLGMRGATFDRWQIARDKSLEQTIKSSDLAGGFTSTTKSFRLFLQSAMLALGAYLVLTDGLNPGAMIAASILMGRALSPIEQAIGQWAVVQRGRKGWDNLSELLTEVPPSQTKTALPPPKAQLDVQQATVVPPGEQQASLRMVSFSVAPGQAVGVIGPSGSGKSTLARALTGVWRTAGGKIRLDGASLDQYDPDILGSHIGYLPQRVQLLEGTIAENIARMAASPDAEKVVQAAQKAAAHHMILKLPDGYDTRVSGNGGRLSGGQIQRIGLARAMYGDPVLLVLDEPNSNLDNDGNQALNIAIRQTKANGGAVLIMAHRPAAIQECDMLLVLEGGAKRAFGPKDDVLREMVTNHQQIKGGKAPGGVS